jgi:hypothetical protein
MLFSGAWGKTIHEKKPEAKNVVTFSLSLEKQVLYIFPYDREDGRNRFSIINLFK